MSEVNSQLKSASKLMSRVRVLCCDLIKLTEEKFWYREMEMSASVAKTLRKFYYFSRNYLYLIFPEEHFSCNRLKYGNVWHEIEELFSVMWLNLDKVLVVKLYSQFAACGEGLTCCQPPLYVTFVTLLTPFSHKRLRNLLV